MTPYSFLELARELLSAPGAAERHWRTVAVAAHHAVHHAVAAEIGLDASAFSGTHRAVVDVLNQTPVDAVGARLKLAKRHLMTLWLMRERAERRLDDSFGPDEAALCLAYAEAILAAPPSQA